MARESKVTREAREREHQAAAREAFLKGLPFRLLKLQAWAHRLDVETYVDDEGGEFEFGVVFVFEYMQSKRGNGELMSNVITIAHKAEEWQVQDLINALQERETFVEKDRLAVEAARKGWDALSPEQRVALGLTRRP